MFETACVPPERGAENHVSELPELQQGEDDPVMRKPATIGVERARQLAEFYQKNGDSRGFSRVDWQYRQNPLRWAIVCCAEATSGSHLAASYSMIPMQSTAAGEECTLAQSIDTLTDPDYRGQGHFVQLAETAYQDGESSGIRGVFGFPNGNSIHGFVNKLGWQSLDPLPVMARPLRTGYILRVLRLRFLEGVDVRVPLSRMRNREGLQLEAISAFDSSHEEIWKRYRERNSVVGVDRSATYLNWRFTNKPAVDYNRVQLRSASGIQGYIVWTTSSKHGGRMGYVMEMLTLDSSEATAGLLLNYALGQMQRDGCDVALAWNMAHCPMHRAYTKSGFIPIPRWSSPIELHFGVRSFSRKEHDPILQRHLWYLSYADSDTV